MIKKNNIFTCEGVIEKLPALAKKLKSKKILLAYDVKAEKTALRIKELLKCGKEEVYSYILTNGEREKTFESVGKIISELVKTSS